MDDKDTEPQMTFSNIEQLTNAAEMMIRNFPEYLNKPVGFNFNLPPITLKLRGKGFDSSIDAPTMLALLKIQENVYKAFALAKYGCETSLSASEKSEMAIFVKVEPGCSFINIDVSNILNEMVGKMNGLEVTACVGMVIAGVLLYKFISEKKAENLAKIQAQAQVQLAQIAEKEKSEILSTSENQFKLFAGALKDAVENTIKNDRACCKELSESSADVEIDGSVISKQELVDLSKTPKEEKKNPYTRHVKGMFWVKKISLERPSTTKEDKIVLVDVLTGKEYDKVLLPRTRSKYLVDSLNSGINHEELNLDLDVIYEAEDSDKIISVQIVEPEPSLL